MTNYNFFKLIWLLIFVAVLTACGSGKSGYTEPTNPTPQPSSRVEQWTQDIDFLSSKLDEVHPNLYHNITKEQFDSNVDSLKSNISSFTDQEMLVEVRKLIALPAKERNIHMYMDWFQSTGYRVLPIQLALFSDGYFVVGADSANQHLVGQQLISIEGMPLEQVNLLIDPLITRDNQSSLAAKRILYFIIPEILEVLDVIADAEMAQYTFVDQNGTETAAPLVPISIAEYAVSLQQNPFLLPIKNAGLYYLQNFTEENFWLEHLERNRTLYIKYNRIEALDNDGQTLTEFVSDIDSILNENFIQKVVVDVRQNNGGDNTTFEPLLNLLQSFGSNQLNELYVLTGHGVVSAAANFVAAMAAHTNAIIVGTAPGGSPSQYGDSESFTLPHSKLVANIPTVYHDYDSENNASISQSMDIVIQPNATDYFQNVDSVLDMVFSR